jgi:hypothetical protein
MMDAADARGKLIRHREDALVLADEINDGMATSNSYRPR